MARRVARSKLHAFSSALHDSLIKNGFVTITGEVSLPAEWDNNLDVVQLLYKKGPKEYEVKCIPAADSCVVVFVENSTVKTSTFEVSQYITFNADDSSYEVKAGTRLETDIKHVIDETRRFVKQNTLEDGFQHRQSNARIYPTDPFAVGSGDLNPLGGGPGMIMDPMRAGPIHRGPRLPSIPPGARYDPMGPGGREPDNDELQPPHRNIGFDHDDMFL